MKLKKEFVDLSRKKKDVFEYYYIREANSKSYVARDVLWEGISFDDVAIRSINGTGDFIVEVKGVNCSMFNRVFHHSFEEVLSLLLINAYHKIHSEDGDEYEDKEKAIQEVFHIPVA
ncbi:MAG: hypothetical protein QXL94_05600 [Candidatus Parvarchaeum sp.]